jgi:hypothetical protein
MRRAHSYTRTCIHKIHFKMTILHVSQDWNVNKAGLLSLQSGHRRLGLLKRTKYNLAVCRNSLHIYFVRTET